MEKNDILTIEIINGAKSGDNKCLEIIFDEFRNYIRK